MVQDERSGMFDTTTIAETTYLIIQSRTTCGRLLWFAGFAVLYAAGRGKLPGGGRGFVRTGENGTLSDSSLEETAHAVLTNLIVV